MDGLAGEAGAIHAAQVLARQGELASSLVDRLQVLALKSKPAAYSALRKP